MIKTEKSKWYLGIIVFILSIIFLIFVAAPLQLKLGMWGLALTEIALLLFGLIPIFLHKWKLSDVIPIKIPQLKQIAAILLLNIASILVVNVISTTTSYFFPQSLNSSIEIVNFYSSVPFVLSLVIIGVMPGICEEVLHRGFILFTLKKHNNDFITMLLMAAIFGVFHLDPYRFLPTAILGFVLTYIMLKTENILLPIIFHTINNSVSVALGYNSGSLSANMSIMTVGFCIVLSAVCPFLFYMANKMLTASGKKSKAKPVIIALTALLIVCGGYVIMLSPKANVEAVYNITFSKEGDSLSSPVIFDDLLIEESAEYDISVSMKDNENKVITTFIFENENGENLWEIGGIDLFANKLIFLNAGKYKASFYYIYEDEPSAMVDVKFGIKKIK